MLRALPLSDARLDRIDKGLQHNRVDWGEDHEASGDTVFLFDRDHFGFSRAIRSSKDVPFECAEDSREIAVDIKVVVQVVIA